jgi:hypothetical protein
MAVKTRTRIQNAVGKVIDTDLGWDALMTTLTRLNGKAPGIEAGVIGSAAMQPHPSSARGETIGEIAHKHEFGVGVPERSFLRATFEANKREYQGLLARGLMDELIASIRARRAYDPQSASAMKRLALRMEGDVKQRIARGVPPPNAPSTIRRKGSSTPLIDSGMLRQSIGAVVRMGRKK